MGLMAKKKAKKAKTEHKTTNTSKIKVLNTKKREFKTGANRQNDSGKGLPSLCSPLANKILAKHMQGGVEAGYDPRNWEKGLTLCSILDSLERHIWDVREGLTNENHVASILWNAHVFVHTHEAVRRGLLPAELNDLTNYVPTQCPVHRKYKGKDAPTTGCDICQMIYENK